MIHLWEIEHPYYCSESNYYSNEPHAEFDSWEDFMEEEGDSDMDYNLIFRFDWKKADNDNELPHDTLQLFYIGQRKGLFRCVEVKITDEDEDSVRPWLHGRFKHLLSLWVPFGTHLPPRIQA
jgi:hypothetical protein